MNMESHIVELDTWKSSYFNTWFHVNKQDPTREAFTFMSKLSMKHSGFNLLHIIQLTKMILPCYNPGYILIFPLLPTACAIFTIILWFYSLYLWHNIVILHWCWYVFVDFIFTTFSWFKIHDCLSLHSDCMQIS